MKINLRRGTEPEDFKTCNLQRQLQVLALPVCLWGVFLFCFSFQGFWGVFCLGFWGGFWFVFFLIRAFLGLSGVFLLGFFLFCFVD